MKLFNLNFYITNQRLEKIYKLMKNNKKKQMKT